MSDPHDAERFPAAVYRETVLAPLFEGVKQHHWRQQMRINRASAIMLAAQGLLTRQEAGAILQALDDIERGTDVAARARFDGRTTGRVKEVTRNDSSRVEWFGTR